MNASVPGYGWESLINKNEPANHWAVFRELYIILDTFGYFGDAKVSNLIDDAFHSYFAAHCDVFVTDDDRTYNKAKAVYKQLGIKTEVYKSLDFPSWLDAKIDLKAAYKSSKLSPQISEICSNTENAIHAADDEGNPVMLYEIDTPLLNYFNRIQFTSFGDGSSSLFLYKKPSGLTNLWFWTEISAVVRKLYLQYGMDNNGKSELNLELEIPEIQNQTWLGRTWLSGKVKKQLLFVEGNIGLAYRISVEIDEE